MIETRGKVSRIGEFIGAVDRRVALSVFCLLLALYTATFNGPAASPDAEVSFQTTSALWRTGSLALSGTPEAEALIEHARSATPGGFPVREGRAGADSSEAEPACYGWYGVGQALVALPFYAVGRLAGRVLPEIERANAQSTRFGSGRSEYFAHLIVGWRTPLFGALTGMLVVLAALRLGAARRMSFLAGLGYGVSTFAWPQALSDLSDVQATFFIALAGYALLVLRYKVSRAAALVLGLSCGLAFLTRASVAPLIVLIDAAFLISASRRVARVEEADESTGSRLQFVACGLLPQLLMLCLWLALNYARFGDVLDSGYGEAVDGGLFAGEPLWATLGLLVSPGKGLFWMAPAVVFAFVGARRARRGGERGFVLFVVLAFLATFVPAVLLRGWHGAWTYGPRYLLPALPALWTLAVIGFAATRMERKPRPLALALLALGVVTQFPGVLVDTFTYHELAVVAAEEHFALDSASADSGEALSDSDRAARRFDAMHFDWGFAAPWAHWRILRHRVAGLGEEFLPSEIFRYPSQQILSLQHERERGFGHLAWVDLAQRLGGVIWPAVAAITLLLGLGMVLAARSLDLS